MGFPWKSFMGRREQDREIRKFIDLLSQAVPSGAGQIFLQADSAAFPDLGSTVWVPVTQYDATVPAVASGAQNMVLDPVAGTIALQVKGLWRLDFTFSMSHNESNQGRTLELRLFNVTDAAPAGTVNSVAIGRNQPGTSYAINTLFEVADADQSDPIRVEMKMATGSGGITAGTFTELGFSATYAGSFSDAGLAS